MSKFNKLINSMSEPNKSDSKPQFDLYTLHAFIAVVEEGGFTAASRRLRLSQSAISLQIAKLEESLGNQLIDRSTRRMELTPAGEKFLSYARRIVGLASDAIDAVSNPAETAVLRVGFTEYLAPLHLDSILKKFRSLYPQCELVLDLSMGPTMIEDLHQDKLDVVIAGPEAENGRLLWEVPLVWTGLSEVVQPDKQPIELVLMNPPCSYRKIAFDSLTEASLPWKSSIQVNSVQAIHSATEAGLGISLLPKQAVPKNMRLESQGLPDLPNTLLMSYMRPDSSHAYAEKFITTFVDAVEESAL